MSLGLALEKTGAAGALAHAIVIHLQWAGTNLILASVHTSSYYNKEGSQEGSVALR
jgi:hypothetical protein